MELDGSVLGGSHNSLIKTRSIDLLRDSNSGPLKHQTRIIPKN